MKYLLFALLGAFLIASFVGCDQAQQALDTIDKAKSFKGDIDKKVKEVKDKARDLVAGSRSEGSGDQGKEGQDRDGEGKERED